MKKEEFKEVQRSLIFNEYQALAMETRLETATPLHCLLQLGAESGEVLSLVAKSIRDGTPEDYRDRIVKELGDVLWNLAAVALDNGVLLEEVAETNLAKLKDRALRNTLQGSGDSR